MATWIYSQTTKEVGTLMTVYCLSITLNIFRIVSIVNGGHPFRIETTSVLEVNEYSCMGGNYVKMVFISLVNRGPLLKHRLLS